MNNMNNDSQGPFNGQQPYERGWQPDSGRNQPSPNGRFFSWIRSSRIYRGRNRWIGGVCEGIASRFGWSVTLVRALMIFTSLFFGAGAAFYGLAWFLLPDESDDRILCEDLIHGEWRWGDLGAFIFMLIAFCVVGPGWLAFLIAALVLWILVNRLSYMPDWRPQTPPSGRPPANGPTYGAPYDGQYAAPANGMPNDSPYPRRNGTNGGAPGYSNGAPGYSDDAQRYGRFQTAPSSQSRAPQSQWASAPNAGPFATAQVPPTFTAPAASVGRRPRRGRRKPAGPLLTLVMFGLTFVAIAAWIGLALGRNGKGGYLEDVIRSGTICIGLICLAVGAVVVMLGCRGRRTGGLHPLVWMAVVMAMVAVPCAGMLTLANSRINVISSGYHRVSVDGTEVLGSSSAQMRQYERGVHVSGDGYNDDTLHIDLSEYAKEHGSHRVKLADGSYGTSSCPTGTLNLVVTNAQVVVTVPDGCWWSIGSDDDDYHDYRFSSLDSIGGADQLTLDNGDIGVSLDFSNVDESASRGVPAFSTNNKNLDCSSMRSKDLFTDGNTDEGFKRVYDQHLFWPCFVGDDKAPETPELVINLDASVNGGVTVQYASDSTLPKYEGKESK